MNKEYRRKNSKDRKRFRIPRRCYFTDNRIIWIDYKDGELLRKFINNQGKIQAASYTGTKRKAQRKLAIAIKRARHIGILPFTAEYIITPNKVREKKND